MSQIFNERMKEIMEIRGRTVQDIADTIGMERKMVTKMRNDPTVDPRMSAVEALADDMGVPVAWLLGRDHEAKVVVLKKTETIRETVEVPVEIVKEVRRKFFNPAWEEATEDETNPV